jgi:hypothetical protein
VTKKVIAFWARIWLFRYYVSFKTPLERNSSFGAVAKKLAPLKGTNTEKNYRQQTGRYGAISA